MKRLLNRLALVCAILIASAWLVRLGMQSLIPLPVSDSMIGIARAIYPAPDQEAMTDLIAIVALLVWISVLAPLCWCFLSFGGRRRRFAD